MLNTHAPDAPSAPASSSQAPEHRRRPARGGAAAPAGWHRIHATGVPLAGLVLAMLAAGMAAPAQAADADPADQAFYRRAASCAAVMKPEVVRLAERWRGGERGVRGEVQRLTELSFTFVGIAYKRGLRGEAADRLLAEAERSQAAQPAPALRQLSADCQTEARQLLDKSNAIERLLVRNRAKARVEHLLDDAPATPPAAQRAGA